MTDLQKAGLGKRIMAAIFDGILLATLAVGLAVVLSFVTVYRLPNGGAVTAASMVPPSMSCVSI